MFSRHAKSRKLSSPRPAAWLFAACLALLVSGCAGRDASSPMRGLATACAVISTPDPERMAGWYGRALGFKAEGPAPGVGGVELRVLRRDGATLVLARVPGQQALAEPKDPPRHLETPGLRNLVFWVDDLEAANAHLEGLGVLLLLKNVPVPSMGVRNTSFRDPDGNLVALWGRARP
jgi:catechol 2,3-dioxygenase-like lactoylglutathione lyase family enzyme